MIDAKLNRSSFDWSELRELNKLLIEEVAPGIFRLSESIVNAEERSFFYLIKGKDEDCLIDGGWGLAKDLGSLRDPEKPLVAIATHSHVDHIGLLHLATRRLAHAAEASVYEDPTPEATLALPYLDGLPFTVDNCTVDPQTVQQLACPLTETIADSDVIEVADRRFLVMHTPGHSPGSITLLEPSLGLLFCADTVHEGGVLDKLEGSDSEALLLSHKRLAEVDFVRALPGHGAILDRGAFLASIAHHAQSRDAN